jgi:hypothetical protein
MVAICEICGKKFKNQFALNGHKDLKNDAAHRAAREKNIDRNDRSELKKLEIQSQEYPTEVLEKVKEILEQEKKDKINDEYFKKTIQSMFETGQWLEKDTHQRILDKKNEDHKLEISSLKSAHKKEIDDLLSEKQDEISFVKSNHYYEKQKLNDSIRNLLNKNEDLESEIGSLMFKIDKIRYERKGK